MNSGDSSVHIVGIWEAVVEWQKPYLLESSTGKYSLRNDGTLSVDGGMISAGLQSKYVHVGEIC